MHMRVSATQLESFAGSRESCNRKWWFSYVRRLPSIQTTSQTFGTTLHEVLERWLLADDLGRGPDGAPVDLYPKGWDATISPADADLIKRFVTMGEQHGLLVREPGRKVESEFLLPLVRDEAPGGAGEPLTIDIHGFRDLTTRAKVVDHKTTSSMDYAKSEEALRKNTQMLVYAGSLVMEAIMRGEEPPAEVEIQHNVFCTATATGERREGKQPRVRKTKTSVSRAEIEQAWNDLANRARVMASTAKLKDWTTVPGPPHGLAACNAYGGCPFVRICGGKESPEDYADRIKGGKNNNDQNNQKKEDPMSSALLNMIKRPGVAPAATPAPQPAPQAAPPPVAPAPQPAPQAAPPPTAAGVASLLKRVAVSVNPAAPSAQPAPQAALPPAPQPVQNGQQPMPWAAPSCKACSGTGVNSRGYPCQVCDSLAAQEGRPTSDQFAWTFADGRMTATAKAGIAHEAPPVAPPPAPTPPPAPAPTPTPEAPPAAEAPAPAKRGRRKKAETPATDSTPTQTPLAMTPATAPQAATGFVLCLGCHPSRHRGPVKVMPIESIFAEAAEALAEARGAESYYALKPFDRADALVTQIGEVAEMIDGHVVTSPAFDTLTHDLKTFVLALKPSAAEVYEV